MVIIDTSVWVNHFRAGDSKLVTLLLEAQVALHPYVFGELACGRFINRSMILSLLQSLPTVPVIDLDEYHDFIEKKTLWGRGLGFVDIHILASARIAGIPIMTYDKALAVAAAEMGAQFKR